MIFGVDNSISSHADNCINNFLVSGEDPTSGINGKFGTSKKKFLLILVKAKFCLSSLCNGDNIYLVVNEKKREKNCKFKGNNKNVNFSSWICLGSIPNKFDYAKSEEVSLKGNVYQFSIDYNAIGKFDILNIRKYSMAKNNIE